jgi:hypothetical protein
LRIRVKSFDFKSFIRTYNNINPNSALIYDCLDVLKDVQVEYDGDLESELGLSYMDAILDYHRNLPFNKNSKALQLINSKNKKEH